jgi:hypothetical protein
LAEEAHEFVHEGGGLLCCFVEALFFVFAGHSSGFADRPQGNWPGRGLQASGSGC